MAGPLEGIRVVELGVWVAGPAAGGILADWGADVIKIEPPDGDPARTFGRMLGISPQDRHHVSPPFQMDNRGKRSVVLDLATEDGKATAPGPARRGRRVHHQHPYRRAAPDRRWTSTR